MILSLICTRIQVASRFLSLCVWAKFLKLWAVVTGLVNTVGPLLAQLPGSRLYSLISNDQSWALGITELKRLETHPVYLTQVRKLKPQEFKGFYTGRLSYSLALSKNMFLLPERGTQKN